MEDKYREGCGVFGIYDHPEAANHTYLGLHGLQHRGQESAGIVSSDGRDLYSCRRMGLVVEAFDEEVLKGLKGRNAIGHVRYSTAGETHIKNAQPFVVEYARGKLAICHNGNLVNAPVIRDELENRGAIFQSTMDTEVIIHLMAVCRERAFLDRLIYALARIRGAYSILLMDEDKLIAARDPHGFRPLVLGSIGSSFVIASETCSLDLIEGKFIREIDPGEILVINQRGLQSVKPFPEVKGAKCVFEFIYFARPDSFIFGQNVYQIRKHLGHNLAKEAQVEADVVIGVPDSGSVAAIGYAEESGFPFDLGLMRSHYVGRTFIEPRQSIRHFGVKLKLNSVSEALKGKRVVVVDDSIVRATTSRKIVKMIRDSGAEEVHACISSPPNCFPCYYGIDTPTRGELIASSHTVDEINQYITSDTLHYLSLEGLKRSVGGNGEGFCYACFTGEYPVEFPMSLVERQFSLLKGFGI